jgi:hypothetical protein
VTSAGSRYPANRNLIATIAIDRGVYERSYDPALRGRYVAYTDESGGSGGDASTISIAHAEPDGRVIQDLLRVWKPPFSPYEVIGEKAGILRAWRISDVTGDRWASGVPTDLYERRGIKYTKAEKVTSDMYVDFLHLANSRRAVLLDNQAQKAELLGLERRVSFAGKEVIGHHAGRSAHDDIINVGAGSAVLASGAVPLLADLITEEVIQAFSRPLSDLWAGTPQVVGLPFSVDYTHWGR